MRRLAEHLIGQDTTNSPSTFPNIDGFDRMRAQLTTLMGKGGFKALLSRALVLAGADVSWLRSVQVGEDGTLNIPDDAGASLGAAEILEGRVALLARLFGLLDAFIGRGLTLSVVRDIWPSISLNSLPLDQEPNDGKAD